MKVFFSFAEARGYVKQGPFLISYRNVLFPFWWNLTGARKWTIFTPGRFDRSKPVPAFQRSSYATHLTHNVVSVFDPLLLRNKDLALGWFLGVKNVDHSEMLGDLFRALSKEFSFSGRDALIYASSGGGLPALRIATQLPHVSVYLTNVQTDPRRYYPKFYKQMTKVAFAGMSEEEIDRRYGERLSSYAWDGDFHLTYAQNLADQFHYLRHFVPYLQAQARSINQLKTLEFVTYDDPVSGHGVLPRATELAIIEAMHHRLPIAELLPNGRICDADHRKKALVHG